MIVEETPTITVTTSATSTTATTYHDATIQVRMVNAVALAVGEELFEAVVANDTSAAPAGASVSPAVSKSPQRIEAESALANACSCKTVDPTATVTDTYTVPPVTTTVGYRIVYISKTTSTRVFTVKRTSTEIAPTSLSSTTVDLSASSSLFASISSGLESTSAEFAGQSPSTSATVQSTIEPITSIANITSSTLSATSLPESSAPIVTAIPFACPEDDGKRVDQVVDGYRLDYLVMCDTELQTEDRVGSPVSVNNGTECMAQCSLVNAQSGQNTCQAASFEPYTGWSCGIPARFGDAECERRCLPDICYWDWWAVYSTSWECTATFTNTIVRQPIVDTELITTTIIVGGKTTLVWGTSTRIIDGGGGGLSAPTLVPASTTEGNGEITTWFSFATQTATGGNGLIPPTGAPTASSEVSTTSGSGNATVSSSTFVSFSTEDSGGITPSADNSELPESFSTSSGDTVTTVPSDGAQYTLSGSTSTRTGSRGEGVIPLSSATGASAGFTTSSWTGDSGYYSQSGGSLWVYPSVSSGSGNFTVLGSTYTFWSTGLGGVITPIFVTGCTAEYKVGDRIISRVSPQMAWLEITEFFVAGEGLQGASVDLRITASCEGYGGMPVTDQEGWMRADVSGVSVTMDEDGRKVKRGLMSFAVFLGNYVLHFF
ncbi:hypothetical protein BDW02DRAFT_581167 [Decorospora gaudefroyi]|uniref:Uncharacterized protein n=1 Tax=Decorospora gaudefroyi TaxID=184978 RepID=A0A6A5K870_9PLEO|nr:hypothetical protein BDW02DRAFT_581167 [Decorospora gaudefroyi]